MSVLQKNEFLLIDVMCGNARVFLPWIVDRHSEKKLVVEQMQCLQIVLMHRKRHHRGIERTAFHFVE